MEAQHAVTEAATATGADRRRYPRLVFSPLDGVTAGLSFENPALEQNPLSIQGMVMNLSRGGLGLGIPRDEMGGLVLAEGDLFEVVELRIAYRQKRLALAARAEIRWHIDADYLDHICFGCAFQRIDAPLGERLRHFVGDNFPHLELS
jgi:hypothetical protein